jgi:hypothetical protein
MKVWYEKSHLKKRIGIITDIFTDYIEMRDLESGEYVIRHITKIEMI